jgi:hypothetical protein
MLSVLLVGVALGTERGWRRRQEYLNRADYHAAAEAKLSAEARALAAELAARFPPVLLNGPCGNPRRHAKALESVMTNRATRAAEHGRLKERYLWAASRPSGSGPGTEPLSSTSHALPAAVAAAGRSSP